MENLKGRPVDATSAIRNEIKWFRGEARHLRALALQLTERANHIDSQLQVVSSHGQKVESKMQEKVWQYRKQARYLTSMVESFRDEADVLKADMTRIVETIEADKQDIKEGDVITEPEFKKTIVVTKEMVDIMNKIMDNENTDEMFDRLFKK